MITLTAVTDKITVVLDAAVATTELSCIITYKTNVSKEFQRPSDRNAVLTTGATPVTLLTGNAVLSVPLLVETINIYNSDTAYRTVTINQTGAEALVIPLYTITLPPKRSLQYTIDRGFFLTDGISYSINNLLDPLNGTFDAFYRQRFSTPTIVFSSKQLSDKQPLFWDDQLISGAGGASTYNSNQASTTLSVANVTAAVRARQTFRRFNYNPGESQLIMQTGLWGTAATGIKRKAGLFDARNGLFFDQQSDGMGATIRTFTSGVAVDNRVLQSNWNIDKLDGTGVSGLTIDFTKALLWFFDFEWLGVGPARFGFFIGDKPIYCHEFANDTNTTVWMSTPNLPLRFEIENTGTGSAVGFTQICSAVISEGGREESGFPFGIDRDSTPLTTLNDASIYPLLAIRLNSSYLASTVKVTDFSIACASNTTFNYFLLLNPTIVGVALAFSAVTNSSIDGSNSATNATTLTGGTKLKSGVSQQNNESNMQAVPSSDFSLGSNIAGTADVVVLAVQRVTGGAETFYAALNIKDQQ